MTEGESKKVYKFITDNPYLSSLAIIVLKSTIYSHSMQSSGEIQDLGKIRAIGTSLFLEMMARNNINHTYISINNNGIIYSKYIDDIPPTEIVVKKYLEGTDKHSYYQMNKNKHIINENNEFTCGPYVRFDWRNPNHVVIQSGLSPVDEFYYLVEEYFGKDVFFKNFLADNSIVKPFGDKTVADEVLKSCINTENTKYGALRMFHTIQYYFKQVGLEIKDVCFMFNSKGDHVWSEVNQDCMRIQSIGDNIKYDKDIWRSGGSGSKTAISEKWSLFNKIVMEWFLNNRFQDTEMCEYTTFPYQSIVAENLKNPFLSANNRNILEKMLSTNSNRRIIVSSYLQDLKDDSKFFIFPDLLINPSFEVKEEVERIKKLATKYYIHVGGLVGGLTSGYLNTIEKVQSMLENSARRVLIKCDDINLINQVPVDRLVVDCGFAYASNIGILKNFKHSLDNLVIRVFFQSRKQILELMLMIPHTKVWVDNISKFSDLEFLWTFPNIIPIVDFTNFFNKSELSADLINGRVFSHMAKYNIDGTIPAIIQDIYGKNKGLLHLNRVNIEEIVATCMIYPNGESTGQRELTGQRVLKMCLNNDSTSFLITVDTLNPFCANGNYSSYSIQSLVKANLGTLFCEFNEPTVTPTPTPTVNADNSGVILSRLMNECLNIFTAQTSQLGECSDLFVDMIKYLSSKNINIDDILNELNARNWNPHLISKDEEPKNSDILRIGITGAKYSDKTETFVEQELGFKLIRPTGRSMKIEYEIIDSIKYKKYFGEKKLQITGIRPKDLPKLLGKIFDFIITYETVIYNYPGQAIPLIEIIDKDICLALICRNDVALDILNTTTRKIKIAAEHPWFVSKYLSQSGITKEKYNLDLVLGSSEGYLINNDYDLCDAIVESGKTLDENNLKIFNIIIPKGELKMGLYGSK